MAVGEERSPYNGTARNLNVAVEPFPGSLVAGLFAFGPAEFFALDEAADRDASKVRL